MDACSNCVNSTPRKGILMLFAPSSSLILQGKSDHSVEEPNFPSSCILGINDCVWFCPGKARRCVPTRLKYPWRTAKPLAKTNLSKTKLKERGEYPFLTREECRQRLRGSHGLILLKPHFYVWKQGLKDGAGYIFIWPF